MNICLFTFFFIFHSGSRRYCHCTKFEERNQKRRWGISL